MDGRGAGGSASGNFSIEWNLDIELFNSGTDVFHWKAVIVPANSWVALNSTSGTIYDGEVGFITVDVASVNVGDDVVISIGDDYQAKQIVVFYDPSAPVGLAVKDQTIFPVIGFEGKDVLVEVFSKDDEVQVLGPWSSANPLVLEGIFESWQKIIIYKEIGPEIWEPVHTNWSGRSF